MLEQEELCKNAIKKGRLKVVKRPVLIAIIGYIIGIIMGLYFNFSIALFYIPIIVIYFFNKTLKISKKEFKLISLKRYFRYVKLIFNFKIIIILIIFYPIVVNSQFDFAFTVSLIIIISISTFFEYFFGITYRLYLSAAQETYIISIIQLITLILNTILIVFLVKFNFSIITVKIVSTLMYTLRPILQYLYVTKIKKIK